MKKILLILCLLLLTNNFIYAENEVKKVYLNEAIDIAIKNNIDYLTIKLNKDIAKNDISTAAKFQNPSIESFYFLGASGNNEPKQFGISENFEIAKRKARKNLAISNFELVQKEIAYSEFDLKMDIRDAYINLVASKSILETLEQQKDLQEELLKIAKSKIKNESDFNLDVIQTEISLNQMITQINSAKVNVKNSLNNFNKIINTEDKIIYDSKDNIFLEENNFQEMLTPSPYLNFPNINNFIDNVIENRLDIKIAKQKIDIAEKDLTVITRQKIPDLQITGGYAYQLGKYSNSGNFNNGAYAGINLINIPLFYNYSPEIQNATLKLKQAEMNLMSIKNKAYKDIISTYEIFLTAAENLKFYENKITKNSEKLMDYSIKNYEKGNTDITALIVMKQSYKSILLGYTQALSEYYKSWNNFLREINDDKFDIIDTL